MLESNTIDINGILLTHQHRDHTAGLEGLLKSFTKTLVYSPDKSIYGTTHLLKSNDLIETTTKTQFFGYLPKLYLEIIVLLLIFFIIFLFEQGNEGGELLIFLGLTLICAIRIFPASNQIILALQTINYAKPSVTSIKDFF